MTSRPTNVRWLIVALLVGFTFLAHFNRISISVAANAHFIGEGKLSKEDMGLVYSAFLLVYTALMLPGGWLLDRIGPYRAMAGMAIGLGVCTALTGALGSAGLSVTAMFLPLLLIRGAAGAASVPLHPGAARGVSLWLPLRERSTANGLVTAGALVGIAVTYPGFGWLMDRIGWQAAFAVAGGALAIFGLLWLILGADRPERHHRSNTAERELVGTDEKAPQRTSDTSSVTLRLFGLVLLTFSYGAIGYVQYLFFYWIEFYFNEVLKVSPVESRQAAFIITMAMAVGMGVGGWLADLLCRLLGRQWGSRLLVLVGMGLCALFSLMGVRTAEPSAVVLCFSLSLCALGLCEGTFWTTAPLLGKRNAGLACALVNTGGNGVGMLAPLATPYIADAFGWSSAVVVACVVCAVGGLLWLGIPLRTGEDHRA
jgi:sugar phosphate permease